MGGRGGGAGGTGSSLAGETAEEKNARQNQIWKYQSSGYIDVNTSLREGKKMLPRSQRIHDAMMKSMKPLKEEKTLWRFYGNNVMSQLMKAGGKGGIFKEKAFVSTSKTRDIFKQEIGNKPGWKAAIIAPKGTMAMDMNKTLGKKSLLKEEKEVVLKPGTKFKILSVNVTNQNMVLQVV